MPRVSLRQLLVLVAVVSLAIVSLRYATAWWETIIFFLAFIVFCGLVIVALVDRGRQQAFAIGMAVAMIGYAVIVAYAPNPEPPHLGLVTTYLLRMLQASIAHVRYFDSNSQEIVAFDSRTAIPNGPGAFPQGVYQGSVPRLQFFLPIGHLWWALLLGYIGGGFARFIYVRRSREQPPTV